MSITNKGAKWEFKNSWFMIFVFFPFLNAIPFFHMYTRVKVKKWLFLGWGVLLLFIALTTGCSMASEVQNPHQNEYSKLNKKAPQQNDYISYDEWENEIEPQGEYEYIWYTPQYKQWEDDLDEYWSEPDREAVKEKYERWNSRRYLVSDYSFRIGLLLVVLIAVVAFIERADFLRKLAAKEAKADIGTRLSGAGMGIANAGRSGMNNANVNKAPLPEELAGILPGQNVQQAAPQMTYNQPVQQAGYTPAMAPSNTPVENVQAGAMRVNINKASEEDFAAIPGISVIDAKRAIAHRDKAGRFNSTDEFFQIINAKPHIVAGAMNYVFVDDQPIAGAVPEREGRRKLDF